MPRKDVPKPYPILFVISSLNRGGAELRLVDVVRQLDPALFRPTVFAAKGGGLLQELSANQVLVGKQGKNVLFSLLALFRTLFSLRPSVVWCVSPGILSFVTRILARLFGVPVVVLSLHGRDSVGPALDRFNRIITRYTTDCVVTVSCYHRDQIVADGAPSTKVVVLYNGVDTVRFTPANKEDKARAKTELLGIDADRPVIGTVGNLRPIKAQEVLIRAAAAVVQERSDARFVIVGEGRLRPTLEQLIQELHLNEQVQLIGSRTDIPRILQAFDVFVLTSDLESCPNTILEAMATGLPVVATAVGGVPELVSEDTGMLISPRDWESLAQAIVHLLDDARLRETMGTKALNRVSQSFTMTRTIAEREELLVRLLRLKGIN